MGFGYSRPSTPPISYTPSSYTASSYTAPKKSETEDTLTKTPWRRLPPLDVELEKTLTGDINRLTPSGRPNLLITGPVGAGKSSFINAVYSIGEGRKVSKAQSGSSTSSFTVQYKAYTSKSLLKGFILRDTMGIELNDGVGFHVDDFIYIIRGNVKNNYKFNPAVPIKPGDPSFSEIPNPEAVTHCVIFVISAVDIYNDIPEAFIRKIGQLQNNIRLEQIPRILVLTHADKLCKEVGGDIKLMFRSKKVQKVVKTASEIFHIDQASIHPVVNYEVDFTLTPEQNIPILLALKQSMHYSCDRLSQVKDDEEIW